MNEKIKPLSQEIRVNEYGGGKSLSFTAPCGMKATVGVMNPNETIDVSTNLPEKVTIIRGRLAVTVPGVSERRMYNKHETAFIPGNQKSVLFEALDGNQVAYECIFYDAKLDKDGDIDIQGTAEKVKSVLES
jgi:uncharacterized protein YaiE (UPF0345 family)